MAKRKAKARRSLPIISTAQVSCDREYLSATLEDSLREVGIVVPFRDGESLRFRLMVENKMVRGTQAVYEYVSLHVLISCVSSYSGIPGYRVMGFPRDGNIVEVLQAGFRVLKQRCDRDRILRTLARLCNRRSWMAHEELPETYAQRLCENARTEGYAMLPFAAEIPLDVLRDAL